MKTTNVSFLGATRQELIENFQKITNCFLEEKALFSCKSFIINVNIGIKY